MPPSTPVPSASSAPTFCAWADRAEAIRATTKRLEKLAGLTSYFAELDDRSLPIAARFFSGIVFPRHDQRTVQVGGAAIYGALQAITNRSDDELREGYVKWGDSGDFAAELLHGRANCGATLTETETWFVSLAAAKGTKTRQAIVHDIMRTLGPLEAKYFVKLTGSELRIGLKEAQVEEALAKAFSRPLGDVRRANLLRGDIGEVALAARHDTLSQAALALFHPLGFMLAQPLDTAEEIVEALPLPFATEDKYDGIRAQVHIGDERVAIFSRTLDDITAGYPDVVVAVRTLGHGLVLDGELLATDPADPVRALPFKTFQQRLGRKAPSDALLKDVPATFVAFDMIAEHHELIIDLTYTERRERLSALPWPATGARVTPMELVETADQLDLAFERARAHGNEGVIAKRLDAPYTPGRRGGVWYKLKRALATLDVVITGAERGHGRRRNVLSDYTFAVRASETDPTLLNVGKAYNGLTDAEILALTERLHALTEERHGAYHKITPTIVLEVTFDIVQQSARHKAGYALRFPRIVRIRDDKLASEIDTLARVKELAGDA